MADRPAWTFSTIEGKALVYNFTVNTSAGKGNVFMQERDGRDDSINAPLYPASSPIKGQLQHFSDSYY